MANIIKGYTPLQKANFTILHQGTTTITDMTNSVYMNAVAPTTAGIVMMSKAVPTAPYSFTAHINKWTGLGQEWDYGLALRDSASDKHSVLMVDTGTTVSAIYVSTWSAWNVYAATQKTLSCGTIYPGPTWFRIIDDGANRKFYLSPDGSSWLLFYSEGRTTYLTPNQIGFFIYPWGTTGNIAVTADHFKVDYTG